jgi:hypothetical protein
MPKVDIDYSNTIIYKITCNDSNVTDKYVGHTTNFVQRKYAHKDGCINEKSTNHKCKLYETIRQHGGWCNWKMEIINFFNCKDHYEARQKEQEYFELLNANLNSVEPLAKIKIKNVVEPKIKQTFYCKKCNVKFTNLKLFEIHNKTQKHLKLDDNSTNIAQIPPTFYECEFCFITCNKISDWKRHLKTRKHFVNKNGGISTAETNTFICECGNVYKERTGLWKHKKKCQNIKINEDLNETTTTKNDQSNKDNLIEYLIKENSEFKTLIMELIKKDNISNSNNNINSNNINNSFNLQFFLNEQCKDAINISEFVDNIKMQLSDLEMFGHTGYVEGVSKILIKNLNELDVIKRPIHCSDLKREVLYIKDNDKWSKENEDKNVIKKVIKDVANKNIRQIPEWMKKHPDCKQSDSKKNDQYLKIVMNAMSGGSGEEQNSNIDKIIKNITKSVIIEK